MSLFRLGDFKLSSGQKSNYKIDCDFLTDADIETVAVMLLDRIPATFGRVEGVPTGGLRLAEAMQQFCHPTITDQLLIVDDVYTSGGSMRKQRNNRINVIGAVIFARQEVEPWVVPLFNLYRSYLDG